MGAIRITVGADRFVGYYDDSWGLPRVTNLITGNLHSLRITLFDPCSDSS